MAPAKKKHIRRIGKYVRVANIGDKYTNPFFFLCIRQRRTDNAFPIVVRFSKETPKVDNHNIADRTKVGSPCKDFIVVIVEASRIGIEFKAVVVVGAVEAGKSGCIRKRCPSWKAYALDRDECFKVPWWHKLRSVRPGFALRGTENELMHWHSNNRSKLLDNTTQFLILFVSLISLGALHTPHKLTVSSPSSIVRLFALEREIVVVLVTAMGW